MTFDFIKKLKGVASPVFRFPTLSDRTTINGRTGSGKTVAGAWLLSEAEFDKQPFIIVNFKREKLFRRIERAVQLDINSPLPDRPGIYHIEPLATDPDAMEDWLWKVWRHENIGLFLDEGYLVPDKGAFKAILTTGRSLHIPVYTLSQRPVKLPRFTISESDYFMSFHLNDNRDRKTVGEFTPQDDETWNLDVRLPDYHSRWYDVGQDFSCVLKPVPTIEKILARFEQRLTPRQRLI